MSDGNREAELENILHREIPLTRSIGIRVMHAAIESVSLSAPLHPNINHKHTAFGGSLYSVAVLAGWSLIYLLLREHGIAAHIVIQESRVSYSRPVTDVIIATCKRAPGTEIERFLKTFARNGKARLGLTSIIQQHGQDAVCFEGQYVIHR